MDRVIGQHWEVDVYNTAGEEVEEYPLNLIRLIEQIGEAQEVSLRRRENDEHIIMTKPEGA